MYCLCVNVYYCDRVTTQLQLTNIPYHINSNQTFLHFVRIPGDELTRRSVSTHTVQHNTEYLRYFVDTQRNAKQQLQSYSVPRPHMHQRDITVQNNCYFSLCYCNADRLIHRVRFINVSYPFRSYWLRDAPPV